MEGIAGFLENLINEGYEMATLNKIGEDLVVVGLLNATNIIKKIGVRCILDTYFEEIIFESNSGDIYELVAL